MPRTARHQKNLRRATEVAAPRVLPPMPFTPFTTAWMENLADPNAWPDCCDCCDDGFDRREYEHWRAFFLEECGKDIDVDYDAVENDYNCDDRYDEYGYDCYDDDYDHDWSYDSDHYHTVHYGAITDRWFDEQEARYRLKQDREKAERIEFARPQRAPRQMARTLLVRSAWFTKLGGPLHKRCSKKIQAHSRRRLDRCLIHEGLDQF